MEETILRGGVAASLAATTPAVAASLRGGQCELYCGNLGGTVTPGMLAEVIRSVLQPMMPGRDIQDLVTTKYFDKAGVYGFVRVPPELVPYALELSQITVAGFGLKVMLSKAQNDRAASAPPPGTGVFDPLLVTDMHREMVFKLGGGMPSCAVRLDGLCGPEAMASEAEVIQVQCDVGEEAARCGSVVGLCSLHIANGEAGRMFVCFHRVAYAVRFKYWMDGRQYGTRTIKAQFACELEYNDAVSSVVDTGNRGI